MSELLLIWMTCTGLAAAALLWMASLILARVLRERVERARERDRQLIQQAFLDIMAGSGDAVGRLRGVRGRARVMAEALLGVLALVRGAERDRLISTLQAFGVDRVLSQRLFRGSIAGRLAAAEALSSFSGPAVVAALRRALTHARIAELRVGLMRSMSDLGEPPSLEEALDDLKGRKASDSLLYLPLVAGLVAADPMAGLRLFESAQVTDEARAILAVSLGGSGEYRALEPLCLAAGAADVELRIAAIRGLTALGHPACEATVLEAMTDPVWAVRAAACEASGRVGLPAAVPTLAAQLEDPVWWVRFRAGEALAALGDGGHERLASIAAEGGDLARRTAAMVLAERGLLAEAA